MNITNINCISKFININNIKKIYIIKIEKKMPKLKNKYEDKKYKTRGKLLCPAKYPSKNALSKEKLLHD